MKQGLYTIVENTAIAKDIYKMRLAGDTSALTAPGQFINIKLEGLYLRRPISVFDYNASELTIIYKTVGSGTKMMSGLRCGTVLDCLCGLGNGFHTEKSGQRPLLIGGGVGVPPLYMLAKKLKAEGKEPTVILGFNTHDDIFCREEFSRLAQTYISTADGSDGMHGFVTDIMKTMSDYTYFYTCGPLPMLKAVSDMSVTSGELSFEERMGCGFGACMGCSCETKYGSKRICKDGPVLEKEEIIW